MKNLIAVFCAGAIVFNLGSNLLAQEQSIESIKTEIERRALQFRSFELQWSMNTWTSAGALNDMARGLGGITDDNDYPPQSIDAASTGSLLVSEGSVRSEFHGLFTPKGEGEPPRHELISITNGQVARIGWAEGQQTRPTASTRAAHAGWFEEGMSFGGGIARVVMGQYIPRLPVITGEVDGHDGRKLMLVQTDPNSKGPIIVHLDPANHYYPERYIGKNGEGRLVTDTFYTYGEVEGVGSMPIKVRTVIYDDPVDEAKITGVQELQLVSIQINPDANSKSFEIAVPPGFEVIDETKGFVKEENGQVPVHFIVTEPVILNGNASTDQEPPQGAGLSPLPIGGSRGAGLRSLVTVGGLLLSILALLIIARRRSYVA